MRSSKVLILVKAFVLLMLFSSIVMPQEYSRTCGLTLKTRIAKQTGANNTYFYFQPADNIAFGYNRFTTGSGEQIFRSIYEVDIPRDLPAGANITKVEFVYQNSYYYDWDMFELFHIPISSYDEMWDLNKKWEITESHLPLDNFELQGYSRFAVDVYGLRQKVWDALETGQTKLYLGFSACPEGGPYNIHLNSFVSVSLKYTYEFRIKHVLKNSSGSGKIDLNIDNYGFSEVNSGFTLQAKIGSAIQIKAKEEQFDGTYFWVWNQDPNTLDVTKSSWIIANGEVPSSSNIIYSYLAKQDYLFSNFTANLKRKFLINRAEKTEFDGSSQTNDIARVVEGNSVNVPYSETLTKATGTYNFAGWEDGGSSLKTPNNNTTYTALYKMPQKSNTQTAFSNSSQRKFIMTPQTGHPYGGDLHLVYESMGKIWYEKSVDGGTTWTLGNNGKPLNTDYVFNKETGQITGSGSYTTAKHPALDYIGTMPVVVWQEQSGSGYVIRLCYIANGVKARPENDIPFTGYGTYSEDVYPEISVKDNNQAVIAIRRNDSYMKGIQVHLLFLDTFNKISSELCSSWIPGTTANTGQFALAADRSSTDKFHIAWQEILGPTSSSMIYTKFNFLWFEGEVNPEEGYYAMNSFPPVTVSNATGYYQSFSPSIFGVNDGTARLAFKGYAGGGIYRVSSCNPDNLSWIPYLRKYSGDLFSTQISAGTETYFVGWTELTGGVYRTIATDASTLSAMEIVNGSQGRDMQINPGGTRKQQFSMSFNSESTTLPYSFTRSEAIETIVGKKLAIKSGRGISLNQNESQLYFILGNVTLDGVPIGFIKAQDTVRLDGNLKKVNHFMTTEPFSLKDDSKVTFAAVSGTKDSLSAKSSLKDGQFASFKVELVDDASGRVIGSYVDEKMDKNNIFSLKEAVYKLNTEGIGNKFVRLRVSVDENMKSEYTISDMFLGDGILLSKSLREKEMNLQGSMEVKEYALSQNYPNPFNPATIINYQIPKASKVTLKVYDILGKEVATLVNGYMEMGKYSAEFNASSLPSGIYIYEIRAGDFVKSSKMMLLK